MVDEVSLEAVNITKSYRKIKVVDGLSFQVKSGQVFGLVGMNGAGKSTTVSMLAALIKPDSGKILFCGQDIYRHPKELRKRLGYVPQDIALYESLSGLDNMKFWGRASHISGSRLKERIKTASSMVGLSEEMLRKKVQEYSGGMKRRLNIAAALLGEPQLVILDEPTAGVDVRSRDLILNTVRKLASYGAAVIYVGHYMEEVQQICNWICILDQGRAVLNAPLPDALLTEDGKISLEMLYRKLV